MSTLKRLKNFERSVLGRLLGGFGVAFRALGRLFGSLRSSNGRRLSILVIPHSGNPAVSLRFTYPVLVLIGFFLVGAAGFALFSSIRYSATAIMLMSTRDKLGNVEEKLDGLRDQASQLAGSAKRFEKVLASTITKAGLSTGLSAGLPIGLSAGQLDGLSSGLVPDDSWFMDSGAEGILREQGEMAMLSAYLDNASAPLAQIGSLMENQGRIMNEIPNIWPIKGGMGHISMYFGQNENPFSGQWYIHNGIDISTFRTGDSILATADGKVIQSGYESGLGNYLILQHSHGFFTRYGHLQAFRVSKGQKVQQGQVIATLGNTGKTTGPHLHYEVHLGTSLIDPLKFLNIRSAMPVGNPEAVTSARNGR